MPRQRKNTPEDEAQMAAITTAPVSFAPGADWKTIKQALEYLGWTEDKGGKLRTAIRKRPEFAGENRVRLVPIEGYEIAPLTYVHLSALDAYRDALSSGAAGSRVGRVSPLGKRYIIRVQDARLEEVRAALRDQFAIEMEAASTPKKRKAQSTAAGASAPAEVQTEAAELVTA